MIDRLNKNKNGIDSGKDPSIIHVLTGYEWDTLHRFALRLMKWQLQKKIKIKLVLSANSPSHQWVEGNFKEHLKSNLELVFPQNQLWSSFLGVWSQNFFYWKLFRNTEYQLVHLHSIDDIFSLAIPLRIRPDMPLIVSINDEVKKSHRKIWLRPITARIDRIILTHEELVENVWHEMRVQPRKTEVFSPLVLDQNKSIESSGLNPGLSEKKDEIDIGFFVPPFLRDLQLPNFIFSSMRLLQQRLDLINGGENKKFRVHLKMFFEAEIKKSYFSQHIDTFAKTWEGAFQFSFHQIDSVTESLHDLKYWIAGPMESLEDLSLSGIQNGVMVLAPHYPVYNNLEQKKKQDNSFINTYRWGDSRDLVEQILSTLTKDDSLNSLGKATDLIEITDPHGVSDLYNKTVRVRRHFQARKGLSERF